MTHKAEFTVRNYPGSPYAASITWRCTCGKTGRIEDGAQGCTMKRARQAHKRHKAKSQ